MEGAQTRLTKLQLSIHAPLQQRGEVDIIPFLGVRRQVVPLVVDAPTKKHPPVAPDEEVEEGDQPGAGRGTIGLHAEDAITEGVDPVEFVADGEGILGRVAAPVGRGLVPHGERRN